MVLKKKHLKVFIYMIIAYFVGLAVILYDFSVSYAASFCDVKDSDWHAVQGGNTSDLSKNIGAISMPEIPAGRPVDSAELGKAKYTESFSSIDLDSRNYVGYNYTLESDDEIVMVVTYSSDGSYAAYASGTMYALALSKSKIYFMSNQYNYNLTAANAWSLSSSSHNGKVDFTASTSLGDKVDMYCYRVQSGVVTSSNARKFAFKTGKMKVFDTIADAENYFLTGDTSAMVWNGAAREYDGDNIYLNDFQMIVHDSNAYSAYYLEFKYTIPEQLRDAASLQLQIEQSYEWTSCALGDSIRRPYTYTGNNYIDLLQYPTGFKLYLSDINSVQQFLDSFQLTHHQRAVLGAESIIDTSALSIGGFGGESIMRITNSKLYMTCYVIANNKFGVNYTGAVDFMTGANDMSSYTPDSSGNYKYNGDLKNQGHYFTDVSTDAAGNTTYNYYYYGTDNSRTEITAKDSTDGTVSVVPGSSGSIINNITMPDHIFVSVSGSTGSSSGSGSDVGNVTIEDDDLSFDSLRESIKDGYGLIDDTDTGVKGDGLIAMLSDLFGYLPAKFVGLIMLGTSSVVGIAVLRMIFKR